MNLGVFSDPRQNRRKKLRRRFSLTLAIIFLWVFIFFNGAHPYNEHFDSFCYSAF